MEAVELDPRRRTIRFGDPCTVIDLGGIAKGHALDAAATIVREAGVDRALLHGGTSTAIAIGAPPGQEGWRIALRADTFERAVILRDLALSVSAPHGRTVVRDGKRLGHVIDPRTGAPATRAVFATVVGPSARRADAWSTALLVRGDRPAAMPMGYASLIGLPTGDGPQDVVGGRDTDVFEPSDERYEEPEEQPCVSSTDARS
jgi:thiamine biosynthesis lipoprotein